MLKTGHTPDLTLSPVVVPLSILLGVIATILISVCGVLLHFHVYLSDYWGVLFYAQKMNVSEPQSLYNGFYPIGYATLLRFFPHGAELPAAYILNAVFAGFLTATTALLVGTSHGRWATMAAFPVVTLEPYLFRHANILGPDWGSAALTGIGVWLLWKDQLRESKQPQSVACLVFAGFFLGLAALFRTHCMISSSALIISFLLTNKTNFSRPHVALLLVFCAVISIQLLINLFSGHGMFETSQKFNIYKLTYYVDWWRPPQHIDKTTIELLLHDPIQLITKYTTNLSTISAYLWPALFGCAFCQRASCTRFCLSAAFTIVVYMIPTALGDSPRALVPIAILWVAPLIMLFIEGTRQIVNHVFLTSVQKRVAASMIVITVGLFLYQGFRKDYLIFDSFRTTSQSYSEVERKLKEYGMSASREVFTDSFDLYFRKSITYRPRHNGGWYLYDLWKYKEENPQMPVDSLDAFLLACKLHGVKFLVLTPDSRRVAAFLGDLYDNKHAESYNTFSPIGEVSSFRIFALAPN